MKRITALILCLSLLLTLLCGCGEGGLPVFSPVREPELLLVGEFPYQYPAITGTEWGEEITGQLGGQLAPLIDALGRANSGGIIAGTGYELNGTREQCELTVYIRSTETEGCIQLASLSIVDGMLINAMPGIPEYAGDGALLDGYLRMSRYGVTLPQPGEKLASKDLIRVLVDYCEGFSGYEIDTSQVRITSEDEYYLKALAAGLCYGEFDYDSGLFGIYTTDFANRLESLLTYIFTDCLGRSSLPVSPGELSDAVDLFLRLYLEAPVSEVGVSLSVSGTDTGTPATVGELYRDDLAHILIAISDQLFGGIEEMRYSEFYDWPSEEMQSAYARGLIDCFPSYGLTSGDFQLRQYQLFDLVNYFVNTCCWCSEKYDYREEQAISTDGLIAAMGWIDSYLDRFERPEEPVVTVDNSRNYQWYFPQFDTGSYSDVNCMPSITAMAIKWYYPDSAVTVAELRELWLPEYDDGWYMAQVVDSLDHYAVPYKWRDISDSIIAELDSGKIILTQMTEAAYDASGHCFVIYGYRRCGDSVQFMIHDPGIYDGLDHSGKPPGEAMLLDSEYVLWIIGRMTFSYISVG